MKSCTTFQGVVTLLLSLPNDDDDNEAVPSAQDWYFDNRADKADNAHSGSSIASGGGAVTMASADFLLPVISTTSEDGVFRFNVVVVRGSVELIAVVVVISDSVLFFWFFARSDTLLCDAIIPDFERLDCLCGVSILYFRFDDDVVGDVVDDVVDNVVVVPREDSM